MDLNSGVIWHSWRLMDQCQLIDSTPKWRLLIPIKAKVMPTLFKTQTVLVEGAKRQELALNGKQ
jgi:hypothetical protein